MGFGGTVAIRAMKDDDYVATIFPGTTVGLQAAIDFLAGAKGHVRIGPGTLLTTTVISLHSNCRIEGSGAAVTVLKRAPGTVGAADPAYSANMFISAALGSNGTLSDVASPQVSIEVSDLTIDGNQSLFSGVVFNTLATGHYGMKFQYVNGIVVSNVIIQEFLQTGIDMNTCANGRLSNIQCVNCGQYALPASRNSLNFNNDSAAGLAAGYAQKFVLTNFKSTNPLDVSIDIVNCQQVAISNCDFDGGLIGFEVEGFTSGAAVTKNVTVSNVTAKNIRGNMIRLSPSAGVGYEDFSYDGIVCDFHPTLHGNGIATIQSGPIFLGRTNDAYLKRIKISNCIFRNINTFSSNTEMAWVTIGLPGTTPSSDIHLSDISFYGANSGEANATNKGFDIYGNVINSTFSNIYMNGVEDVGIHVRPGATTTVISDLSFSDVTVDGCQADGFKCLVDLAGASITHVDFNNCIAKNPAISNTSLRGFFIGCSTATGTCSSISVKDSRVYRTSSVCNGMEVLQTGASTVDQISIVNDDMSGIGGGGSAFFKTGTPTNVWFEDIMFKGNAVASAGTITLGRGNWFGISGTSAITTMNPYTLLDARPITFVFGGAASFLDLSGNMVLNGDFVGVNNATITMRYDWVNGAWYEICRSLNAAGVIGGRGADIASAATIAIPIIGDVFHVTGATNITNGITVNAVDAGRTVVLIFDSTPTVTATGTSHLNGNMVATASDTLTIKCDGTNWYELGRSPNV